MKVTLTEIADWMAVQLHDHMHSPAASDEVMRKHIEWLHAGEMELRDRIAEDQRAGKE